MAVELIHQRAAGLLDITQSTNDWIADCQRQWVAGNTAHSWAAMVVVQVFIVITLATYTFNIDIGGGTTDITVLKSGPP